MWPVKLESDVSYLLKKVRKGKARYQNNTEGKMKDTVQRKLQMLKQISPSPASI